MCQFPVEKEDVLDGSVGMKNLGVDLMPDLKREDAEELGADL